MNMYEMVEISKKEMSEKFLNLFLEQNSFVTTIEFVRKEDWMERKTDDGRLSERKYWEERRIRYHYKRTTYFLIDGNVKREENVRSELREPFCMETDLPKFLKHSTLEICRRINDTLWHVFGFPICFPKEYKDGELTETGLKIYDCLSRNVTFLNFEAHSEAAD